jgi:Arp2/3 complex, 34 kD subunit p34-Arc
MAVPDVRDDLIRRVSLLKRNVMAAPFEQAFEEFEHLQEEAAKYTSEAAPQGVMEGGEVRAIHYREEEAIFIKASHDRVTVIFSTIFRDETDRVFGKVFLQVIQSSMVSVGWLTRTGIRRRQEASDPECTASPVPKRPAA